MPLEVLFHFHFRQENISFLKQRNFLPYTASCLAPQSVLYTLCLTHSMWARKVSVGDRQAIFQMHLY